MLLPAAVLAASSSLPIAPSSGADSVRPGAQLDYGASGRIEKQDRLSSAFLDQADHLATEPVPSGSLGIPAPMLAAYRGSADRLATTAPSCGVHWSVLASIGRIESSHARSGRIDVTGTTVSAILGPRLTGAPGLAAISDTDGGQLDGDPVWDRAVGAMQFIPSTWRPYAADGNADGVASPHNVHDATLAAGKYLCSGGLDLRVTRDLATAVFRYNHSESYVRTVLVWAAGYARGVLPTPAELAPEMDEDEVLAGQRLPDGSEVVALPPPGSSVAPTTPPGGQNPPDNTPPVDSPTSTSSPTSTPDPTDPPENPDPPETTTPSPGPGVPELCDEKVLFSGEFVTKDEVDTAPTDLPPGTSKPGEAIPGETVYVESPNAGPLMSCVVSPGYQPPSSSTPAPTSGTPLSTTG